MQTLVRLPLFALCGVAGYLGGRVLVPPSPADHRPGNEAKAAAIVDDALVPATAEESSLVAEWERLRGTGSGGPEALPGVYADVKDIKDAFRRRAFRSALLAEWAASNPQAALAYLGEKDTGMITQFFREWLRLDPNAAVTALLAGSEKQRGNLRAILPDIAKVAPERLAEVVSALPKSPNRWDSTVSDAFAFAAAKDPEAARRAAESVTGPMRGQALAGVARAWAEKAGESALNWGQAMPPGEDRDAVLKAVLTGWAKTDPLAALERIDLVPPGGEEGYYASDVGAQVLREAGKKDWDGTMRWLLEHPGKLGRSSLDGLQDALSHRLAVDPGGTLRSISTAGVPGLEHVIANSLLNDGYAQRDTVWQWASQQPSSDFTKSLQGWVINAVAWKEPMLALSFLDGLPDTPENKSVLERGVSSMLNGGNQMHLFDAFLDASSPRIRPLLLEAGFSYGLSQSMGDPQRWIKRLDELPEDRRLNGVTGIASGWAMSDPTEAMGWALSLPEGPQRDSAFRPILGVWANNDPHGISQWIQTQPAGVTRDTATQTLVLALMESQPETAWTWALSIGQEDTRSSALKTAYMGLRRKNPEAAAQLLEGSNLPPQQIEQLRKAPPLETSPRVFSL